MRPLRDVGAGRGSRIGTRTPAGQQGGKQKIQFLNLAQTHYNNYTMVNCPTRSQYRIAGKFGGELNLAVLYYYTRQIKIRQIFLLAYIRMAIPYRTAKFKSANILIIAILGSTANFNSRQYFRLYGNIIMLL